MTSPTPADKLDPMRARVARNLGLTTAQARRLQGSTVDELEADADELLETFGGQQAQTPPGERPKEALVPGNTGYVPSLVLDPTALVADLPRL